MKRHIKILFLGLLPVLSGWASPIFVSNSSFETLPGGGLPNGPCGLDCRWSTTAIPGWINGGDSGQFQPGTQSGTFTYFNTLSDDITSAYSNNGAGAISQTVVATVQAGVLYTLMVDIGDRNDLPPTGSAFLLVNGNYYGSSGAFVPGGWGTFTSTYVGTVADAGSSITIELRSAGVQANFDNVRLSDSNSIVPEPASLALFAFGLVSIAASYCLKLRNAR